MDSWRKQETCSVHHRLPYQAERRLNVDVRSIILYLYVYVVSNVGDIWERCIPYHQEAIPLDKKYIQG
jgi:hypothetical protein